MLRFDREATLDDVREDARELLQGAIDVHVHASPDPYADRRMDAAALVERAVEAGMGGIVLKSHEYNTQPLAWLLDRQNEDIRVYGGIALDHCVGGLNMEAVSVAMRIGTTMVWMPTFDAQAWRDHRPGGRHSPGPGITVLDEMGDLRHEVMAILDLIGEHDAVLATGHLSTPEVAVIGRESRRRGIRTVVTHGSFYITVEVQQELAGLGAYVEQVATATSHEDGDEQWELIESQVRAVGPEHVILSTDFGQARNPEAPVGFGLWIEHFLDAGYAASDIGRMVRENPAELLG
ncbi:MAG: hypothetical protein F4056_01385 [Chloroflexi bacterium]|nr:hypothetical protein [Chloroflexota bacterium]